SREWCADSKSPTTSCARNSLRALAKGNRRRNRRADLGEQAGCDLPRLLAGLCLAAGRLEETGPQAWAPRKAGHVGGALDRDADQLRLGDLEREAADAAARPQHLAARAGAFREDADA